MFSLSSVENPLTCAFLLTICFNIKLRHNIIVARVTEQTQICRVWEKM